MTTGKGQGVSGGIAAGRLLFYRRAAARTGKRTVQNPQAEIERFEAARAKAVAQLAQLQKDTAEKLGEEGAQLFEVHQMLLEDDDYRSAVLSKINDGHAGAEYAVSETAKEFSELFSNLDDSYMQARGADFLDISNRILRILEGAEANNPCETATEPYILAADDLMPSETAQLDTSLVRAVVLSGGAANSHTAIFAVTMGIPAVIRLGGQLKAEWEGKRAAVDGTTGSVYIEPDAETTVALNEKRAREEEQKRLFQQLKQRETRTKDGDKIELCANIGSTKDVRAALQNGAEGVGLFRSEFLYLEKSTYPTEEEQFAAYREVAEKMGGKRVVIRTLDIGADKQAAYFELPHEENPAMGLRAIRICLTRPELFKVQLRALYRASAYGKIAIMFPMITSVSEVRKIKEICSEVREELARENIPFSEATELGIMIETPAAALISDELAREVDFFSVGTNDLTQYTLAVDRGNAQLAPFCDTHHKAVLRLIELAATNAHKVGIWIGICGELAADEALTQTFLGYGIDELSVSPFKILGLRAKISEISVK